MSTSQIFTIGTALRRAEDNGVPVEVLVEGQWLRGNIAGLDGDGLVLVTPERTQCVVRNAHISVVRILADLSFDEEPSEPQETSYTASSHAPPAGDTGSANRSHYDDQAAQRFSWASASEAAAAAAAAAPGASVSHPVSPVSEDPDPDLTDLAVVEPAVVIGHSEGDHLVLDAADPDATLALDGGAADGPLELESGAWAPEVVPDLAPEPASVVELLPETTPEPVAAPVLELVAEPTPEPTPEPAAESAPEPLAEVTTPEVVETTAKEDPADLVSRLLAESLREAGIDPEAAVEAETLAADPVKEIEPAAETPAEAVELLHPDKAPATEDEPRIFALPAPTGQAEAPTPEIIEPVAPVAADPVAAEPVAADPVTPDAEPTTEPAAEPAAEAAPADDWRSMLEGLRGEATAPSAQPEPEKRRGRRLVMR